MTMTQPQDVTASQRVVPLIDFDNHYYEAEDCCTRYIDPKFADRAVRVRRNGDEPGEWYVGEKPLTFSRQVRHHVLRPGAFALWAGDDSDNTPVSTDYAPWRNRDARLALMDEQGVEVAVLNPTFGLTFEEDMAGDVETTYANMTAFNDWLFDDWGYSYQERIFTAPLISLADPDRAAAEVDRVLARGARLLGMRTGPAVFGRSPADPVYDPVWSRIEEADVPVIYHIGVTSYFKGVAAMWGELTAPREEDLNPFTILTCMGARPAFDTIANLMSRGLFDRFPRLKVISLENGSTWADGFAKLGFSFKQQLTTTGSAVDKAQVRRSPRRVSRENVWISPYPEESYRKLIDVLGPTQVLYGSDWPHPEGTPEPGTLLSRLDELTAEELRLVTYENAARLLKISSS